MNKFFLALLLALSIANAGWVAQLGNSSLTPALLNSTRYNNDSLEYAGAFGSYMVAASQTGSSVSVVISGPEESVSILERELGFLSGKGVLRSGCADYLVYNVTGGGYEACNGNAVVFYCPSCEIAQERADDAAVSSPPAPPESEVGAAQEPETVTAPPSAATGTGSAAQDASPSAGAQEKGAKQSVDGAVGDLIAPLIGGAEKKSAASSEYGGKSAAGESAPQGQIGTEQVLQLFAAFLIVVVAAYLMLQMFQARQVTVQEQGFDPRAVELMRNETRQGIMQELSSADKIPTDLSIRLGKSKASIVEHLEALMDAGLVERLETPGRKFVYYTLTRKGKQLLLKMAG